MGTRKILIASIVSTDFLRRYRSIYDESLIQGRMSKTILRWCIEYYDKHKRAPQKHIEDIFSRNDSAGKLDHETADDIAEFLNQLSNDYEEAPELNIDFLLKQAEAKLQEQSLKNLAEDIETHVENGEPEKAQVLLSEYKRISLPESDSINPLTDKKALREAFSYQSKPLLHFPGMAGEALNDQFVRDSFVAFMGREKIGKTWLLMETAFRALADRRNVAFFQAGDLSWRQQITRFAISLTGRSNREKYCGQILVPVADCWHNQTDLCGLDKRVCDFGIVEEGDDSDEPELTPFEEVPNYKPCTACLRSGNNYKGTSWFKIRQPVPTLKWKEAYTLGKRMEWGNLTNIELFTYPMKSISVTNIDSLLYQKFNETGFVPDVIIIDYADILAPQDSRKQERHQENDKWEALRKLSQVWSACVITATQADADSYTRKTISMKNFTEDKRKFAHVTAMFGLNQTQYEKRFGRFRINNLVVREDYFEASNTVTLLQSLQQGRPLLFSYV